MQKKSKRMTKKKVEHCHLNLAGDTSGDSLELLERPLEEEAEMVVVGEAGVDADTCCICGVVIGLENCCCSVLSSTGSRFLSFFPLSSSTFSLSLSPSSCILAAALLLLLARVRFLVTDVVEGGPDSNSEFFVRLLVAEK